MIMIVFEMSGCPFLHLLIVFHRDRSFATFYTASNVKNRGRNILSQIVALLAIVEISEDLIPVCEKITLKLIRWKSLLYSFTK